MNFEIFTSLTNAIKKKINLTFRKKSLSLSKIPIHHERNVALFIVAYISQFIDFFETLLINRVYAYEYFYFHFYLIRGSRVNLFFAYLRKQNVINHIGANGD